MNKKTGLLMGLAVWVPIYGAMLLSHGFVAMMFIPAWVGFLGTAFATWYYLEQKEESAHRQVYHEVARLNRWSRDVDFNLARIPSLIDAFDEWKVKVEDLGIKIASHERCFKGVAEDLGWATAHIKNNTEKIEELGSNTLYENRAVDALRDEFEDEVKDIKLTFLHIYNIIDPDGLRGEELFDAK